MIREEFYSYIFAMKQVYISGALTGISSPEAIKGFYENIGKVCDEVGYHAYVPHLHTDPIRDPDVSSEQVNETDRSILKSSRLVIAYVGLPSLGTGIEIEMAYHSSIPVILLYEKGKRVSRLARGNPAVEKEIVFENFDEALKQLYTYLTTHK